MNSQPGRKNSASGPISFQPATFFCALCTVHRKPGQKTHRQRFSAEKFFPVGKFLPHGELCGMPPVQGFAEALFQLLPEQ